MTTEPVNYPRQKIVVLIGLTLFWFVNGLFSLIAPQLGIAAGIIFLLSALGWGIGIFYWCMIDAKERGDELSGSEKVVIVLLGFLALIWYLFHTRGAKGGFKALGWILLYAVCGFVLNTVLLTVAIIILKMAGMSITV